MLSGTVAELLQPLFPGHDIERTRAAHRAWVKDGVVLSAAEFAARRAISPESLATLEAAGELFTVEVDGVRYYPAELLKLTPDLSAALCRVLAGTDGAHCLVFLLRVHGALGGRTVAEAVASGRQEEVLRLARRWREGS